VAKSEAGFTLDYAEIIDENDFSKAVDATLNKRAIIAGWLNGVRLIDNMEMKLGAVR
jgi:pantoate--beta-alanine ligase